MILEPPKINSWHCFHCLPIYFPWGNGARCHDLSFLSTRSAILFCLWLCDNPTSRNTFHVIVCLCNPLWDNSCHFLCKAFPGPHPVFTSQFLHGLIFIQQLHFNSCALVKSYDQRYLQKSLRKTPLGRLLYCLLWNKAGSFSWVWQQITVYLHIKIFHLGVKVFQWL